MSTQRVAAVHQTSTLTMVSTFSERPDQPVGVLLVRHEVVAGVEDHLDVGIGVGLTVVEELLAGVFQRLGDPRGRHDLGDEVAPLAHAHRRAVAALRHAAVAVVPREPEARARLADLAGQRLEVDDGPIGHFAVLGALNGPGPGDLGGRGGEELGQFLDLGLVHAGDLGGPGRRLRRAVGPRPSHRRSTCRRRPCTCRCRRGLRAPARAHGRPWRGTARYRCWGRSSAIRRSGSSSDAVRCGLIEMNLTPASRISSQGPYMP